MPTWSPTPAVFAALTSRENPGLPPFPADGDWPGWLTATRNDLEPPALRLARLCHGLDHVEDIGGAAARQRRDGVLLGLGDLDDQADDPRASGGGEGDHDVADPADLVAERVEDVEARQAGDEEPGGSTHA